MAVNANMADHMAPGGSSKKAASAPNGQDVLKPIPAVAKLLAARIKALGSDELKALVGLINEDNSDALAKLFPELKPIIDKAKTMNPQDVNTDAVSGGQSQGQSQQSAPQQ